MWQNLRVGCTWWLTMYVSWNDKWLTFGGELEGTRKAPKSLRRNSVRAQLKPWFNSIALLLPLIFQRKWRDCRLWDARMNWSSCGGIRGVSWIFWCDSSITSFLVQSAGNGPEAALLGIKCVCAPSSFQLSYVYVCVHFCADVLWASSKAVVAQRARGSRGPFNHYLFAILAQWSPEPPSAMWVRLAVRQLPCPLFSQSCSQLRSFCQQMCFSILKMLFQRVAMHCRSENACLK